MNYQICSKHSCQQQVLPEPDKSLDAITNTWIVGNTKRMIIAYPFKPITRPAYCYFHRNFPNYPNFEPFERSFKF